MKGQKNRSLFSNRSFSNLVKIAEVFFLSEHKYVSLQKPRFFPPGHIQAKIVVLFSKNIVTNKKLPFMLFYIIKNEKIKMFVCSDQSQQNVSPTRREKVFQQAWLNFHFFSEERRMVCTLFRMKIMQYHLLRMNLRWTTKSPADNFRSVHNSPTLMIKKKRKHVAKKFSIL